MSDDKKKSPLEYKDGNLSVSFGIQDATKEAFDHVERERIIELLADRDIGIEELAVRLRAIYKKAGSPCGPGAEGFVEWLEKA